ncbi:MAG: NAD+ synthase [Alphaproteobacteria bacterium]|nr:NAD+ synthase [Alphaproteobacteria bacterium]
MQGKLSFAFAQLNPTVGDISGNIAKLRDARARAAKMGADLLVTTEMYLCAYPAEDLVLKPSFQNSLRTAVEGLAVETQDGGPAILIGMPWRENGRLYNAAVLLDGGKIAAKTFKYDLPNYGPFDEKRIFTAGPLPSPLLFRGVKLGVMICEDMWTPACAAHLRLQDAQILIVPNGSPFEVGKTQTRRKLAEDRVKETKLPLVYLNQFGGQDELVFDGASFALNAKGKSVFAFPAWEEKVAVIQLDKGDISSKEKNTPKADTDSLSPLLGGEGRGEGERGNDKPHPPPSPHPLKGVEDEPSIYHALMTGLRDYANKNDFPGVVLGLSGGVDSALAAVIAVDALGADRVWCVMLPSPYTSTQSTQDAKAVAQILGCKLDTIPIAEAMKTFDAALSPTLKDKLQGIVSENIQSRCRGLILMALSNASGHMVLSTGNKSEMSVGYATLYGDMCGGFAVLKDVYKTEVYNLARWRNAHKPASALGPTGVVIPAPVLTKAPTAELRPDQKDQDSLPPYDILDGILESLIEQDMGMREIMDRGYDTATVARVWAMLDKAEYKRRQSPPGVKITRRSLSRDRRYPLTNKYRERSTTR